MCLSIHFSSVTTESVDGSRLSAQVLVIALESQILNVIAIPYNRKHPILETYQARITLFVYLLIIFSC